MACGAGPEPNSSRTLRLFDAASSSPVTPPRQFSCQENSKSPQLKLDHDRVPHAGFVFPQIGAETGGSSHTREARSGRQERAWGPAGVSHYGSCNRVWDRAGVGIGTWGYAAATGPVRYIRVAIPILHAESNVLSWHVVKRGRGIPGFERITRVLCEIRRAGDGIGSINGWKQGKVASWIRHRTAAQRDAVQVLLKPPTVVNHPAGEGLLTAGGSVVVAI